MNIILKEQKKKKGKERRLKALECFSEGRRLTAKNVKVDVMKPGYFKEHVLK